MLKQFSKLLPNVPRLTLHTNHSLPHPYLRQGHRNVRFYLRSKKYLYPEHSRTMALSLSSHGFYILVVHYLHFVSAFDTSAALELRSVILWFGAIVSSSVIPWTQSFAWVNSCGKAYGQLAAGLLCASSWCAGPIWTQPWWSAFVLFVLFFDLKMTQCPLEVECATNLQDRLFWVVHDTAANGWLEFIALWLLLDQDEEEEQHEVSELMVFAATFVLLHIAQLGLTNQFQVNVDSCCWRNQAFWILCDVCGWDTILLKTLWTFGS